MLKCLPTVWKPLLLHVARALLNSVILARCHVSRCRFSIHISGGECLHRPLHLLRRALILFSVAVCVMLFVIMYVVVPCRQNDDHSTAAVAAVPRLFVAHHHLDRLHRVIAETLSTLTFASLLHL